MTRRRKRYILWNHDGVLVDTEPLYFESTSVALGSIGVDLSLDGYLADMGDGVSAWDRALRDGIDPELVQAQRDRRDRLYQQLLVERDIAIPGFEEVLATLAADYAMAIVTTARKADFELIHARRDIVGYMDFVLTNGDYEGSKPAPDPYLTALERFGASAEEAVVVEDSARGLRSAIARQNRLRGGRQRVRQEPGLHWGEARIRSLDELPALLPTL